MNIAPSLVAAMLLMACAAQPPLAKNGVTQAQRPNWILYEQCMRARGYAR